MRVLRTTRFVGAVLALAGTAACWAAVTPDDCHVLRKHGHETEAINCYESLGRSTSAYLRAEGYWGLGQYDQANEQFRIAIAQPDAPAMYRVRWGMLLHERFNDAYQFRLKNGFEAYGNRVRFQWEAGGTKDAPLHFVGTDFGILASDGRLKSVTGFVDEAPASIPPN